MSASFLPVRAARLDVATAAAQAGLHPELVERFAELGLVPWTTDAAGRMWFPPAAPALLRRIVRLHADLALNYAAIALVLELLDRIEALEGRRGTLGTEGR
ncbi:chaperone modulator CbpM [Amnibacterium sp.]|uniref:chaperone modulator CbpM n=1 Tax=Amnibacterium sp. TaxID=1872496 RepID=UPI003F7B4215